MRFCNFFMERPSYDNKAMVNLCLLAKDYLLTFILNLIQTWLTYLNVHCIIYCLYELQFCCHFQSR